MKILVLDGKTVKNNFNFDAYGEIGEVVFFDSSTQEEAAKRLEQYNPEIVVVNKVVMNEELFKKAPAIKMISETATGYNNIDVEYAKNHGIAVTNVAGYSTDSVAQHTFALCLYLLEHLSYYDEYVKSGKYTASGEFCHVGMKFTELKGKTWGIIGLGAIGRAVADIASAFGCKVVCYSASGHKYDTVYEQVDFDELLEKSDIISIHAPLNDKTENLMNMEAFKKMKKSAILINVGRGPIVNDEALATALNDGIIAAAGLDVISKEPLAADNPLSEIKDSTKLVITPHIAWGTEEAKQKLTDEALENIKAFLNGESRNRIV